MQDEEEWEKEEEVEAQEVEEEDLFQKTQHNAKSA